MSEPEAGTRWAHRQGGRVCKVVDVKSTTDGKLVEYRYVRTAGGMGQNRTTPTQTMELTMWRSLFTKPAP